MKAGSMFKTLNGKRLIDLVIELIDQIAAYIKQNAKQIVDESIAKPLQNAGRKAGLFFFAFVVFSIASIFVAVGLFLAFASVVGYPVAYLLIGIILIIAGLLALRAGKH
jgi:hypothetical protein